VSGSENTVEDVFRDFPFLAAYFRELRSRLPESISWSDSARWLRDQIRGWESMSPVRLPLLALEQKLGLSPDHRTLFLLAALVEEDSAFGNLYATLQQPVGFRRPTYDLLREVMSAGAPSSPDVGGLIQMLIANRLVEVLNPTSPRAEWTVGIAASVWSAARGDTVAQIEDGVAYCPAEQAEPLGEMVLEPELARRVQLLAALLASPERGPELVIIRGLPGSSRAEMAASLARELGLGTITVDNLTGAGDERLRNLGPLCTLRDAVPVVAAELGPGESLALSRLPGCVSTEFVILGRDGGVAGPMAESAVTLWVEPDDERCRLLHWDRALPAAAETKRKRFAAQFTLPSRYIRQAALMAESYAAMEQREEVGIEDVRQAARSVNRQVLDSLATRLEPVCGWGSLVVGAAGEMDLRTLERRCRHRERLSSALAGGLPGGLNRGVRALFEGPSGTGKTLAARVLAAELGMDIYRVDLAATINKYVGETEKNLSKILSRAEDLDVILLLDEGDSLLTKRTEVHSANDRYANMETHYLLQRLETYTGIVLVTTNAPKNIDTAFRRRMDVVVSFPLPDTGQRLLLWRLHLRDNRCEPRVLEEVAARYNLTGGQIRNAAISATLSALDRGRDLVDQGDLRSAIEVEYRKAGASFPGLSQPAAAQLDPDLSRFLGAVS
jgi:hypothetical protein